ncbi:patatin-like phospholipase family protein [Serpentinicella alkaliphila]|uniref:NTE family protein n=1 Tax=Serpentinicella alkaliphila TaxID=1734049 RepID=A0A4R2TVS3_9FIRM|nr:patatin-like phospholipase family protein [Serpentinicella alkaliphila]QUH25294.1 patatin-like phospholipase family protein [Serpentinicella alkaliphila]TCQ07107.1 NTE family protein [Serpentinicella alkaliphila]
MLGLTLEGGGARGSYQIGAWKAFREIGIEFDGITGTSVGALNGALMVQDDYDLAYELWYNMEPYRILNVDDRIYEVLDDDRISSKELNIIYKQIVKVVKGIGLDSKPLQLLVNKCLKEAIIRNSHMDFGFVTVCLTDLKPLKLYKENVPIGKMGDYLLASSCLPIFRSKEYDGKKFLDGAFYNNLPVDMLYEKGYKEVIALRLNSQGIIKKNCFKELNLTFIKPYQDLGKILDFSRERARRNLQLGYYDTLKHFKNLKGKEYYILGDISDEKAFKFFMSLSNESIIMLGNLFNIPQYMSLTRALLEGIIPKLFNLLDLDEQSRYSDLFFAILEQMALRKKINPFHIYTIDMLVENIERYNSGDRTKPKKYKSEIFPNKKVLIKRSVDIILLNEPYIHI